VNHRTLQSFLEKEKNWGVGSFQVIKIQRKLLKTFFSPLYANCTGILELKEDTIESLLAAACLLQLSQVIEVCCNFLMKQLHPSNCLGIRSFGDAQGCTELLKVAHTYTMVRCTIELLCNYSGNNKGEYLTENMWILANQSQLSGAWGCCSAQD